jgi:hypothetical protein
MRVLIEDTSFSAQSDFVRLEWVGWLDGQPRDLWIRTIYSAPDSFTIWACATRDDAIARPCPVKFLATPPNPGQAVPEHQSFILRTPGDKDFCGVGGLFLEATGLPDVLWAYIGDSLGGVILDKAAEILRTYAYPGAALGGIQPRDITVGPSVDYVASLPAVELEALAPIDALSLHPGELQSRRFRVSVRTPGPESSAWRSAIEYSRAVMSILADEHRRNIPAGILCRYLGGEGPVPDGPSEGGQKCSMTFEVVGIEARPDGPLTVA